MRKSLRRRRLHHGPVARNGMALAAVLALACLAAPAAGDVGPEAPGAPDAARDPGPTPAPSGAEGETGAASIPPICTALPPTGPTDRFGSAGAFAGSDPPAEPGPPEYYAFPLVSTGRIQGTARAEGRGRVAFPASSPFGVALAEDGSYRYDLVLSAEGLPEPDAGRYVVWLTTPSLDRIRRVGPLPPGGELRGRVSWNKFLVVITLEPDPTQPATADDGNADGDGGDGGDGRAADGGPSSSSEMWSGPIVMRGMSRSGMMHTMAGHGPFEQENCAAYGY